MLSHSVCLAAGRLDWKAVQPLVQQSLGDLKLPIYLYTTFHAGVQADESGE